MIYLHLFLQFFHIGVFSFGGGYATLPFLYDISEKFGWYTLDELNNMLAVASITPGPVGINMATFAGFKTAGILGSLLATSAIIIPSLIFVIIISKFLNKFCENVYVKSVISVLKPLGCGLLTAVGVHLLINEFLSGNFNIIHFILFGLMIFISLKKKLPPAFYLALGAVFGLIS
ncbi:chromate transporter [bacterium]|nr:chromate transporter [bacterium]